ncbi:4-hydroxybenzoate polyprenyltransferase, mitochondrial-like isoform X2 [Mizuhopecten yessoensis]|uniref:4-hydroxybenzoate polyprenyltransferase, mitochondrial n=1 Tax=Mizuhopecten yessoensis TaxID=6573 RepID=A0A210PZP1_MIZYE|nr:4-hydroxybenzoate polyprenyltransferase, mitochondrial-like isoform X2 [Mizuhopecten yessoensis]OWF41945.1 4-hydroxybenzoate polyprenyltransferase, mitochondrial [Mizuhopecten yessoensis]
MRLQKALFRGVSYSCNVNARISLCRLQDISPIGKMISRLSSTTSSTKLTSSSVPDQCNTSPAYDAHVIKTEHVKLVCNDCNRFKDILSQNSTNNHSKLYNKSLWSLHNESLTHTRHVMNNMPCVSNFHSMKNSDLFNKRKLMDPSVYLTHPLNRCLTVSPKGILDASPKMIQPYLRLIRFDKPIGTYLLYWPCTWSIAMAATPGHLPDLWLLTLFGAGAFFMRGAGCIVNDMWDRDIDKKVERTKLRPLTSGELSMFQGLVCLGGMLSVSLAILCQLNMFSIILGASSMLLVILYPLAKRYTYWPQAMLGVTLNWGVLISWSAINGGLDWSVLSLYVACVMYTIIYDSIYSHQDKYDDMLIGVKSTALRFGDQTKYWLSGFGVVMISGLTTTGIMCDQTWPYYTAVAFTCGHLFHQIWSVDLDNADDCAAKFRSNTRLGFLMFLGVTMGTLLKVAEEDEKENKIKAM